LSNIEFVQVARVTSEKILFVPLKSETVEAIDLSALDRPDSEKVDPKKGPCATLQTRKGRWWWRGTQVNVGEAAKQPLIVISGDRLLLD
jgi:hypothetical protein